MFIFLKLNTLKVYNFCCSGLNVCVPLEITYRNPHSQDDALRKYGFAEVIRS